MFVALRPRGDSRAPKMDYRDYMLSENRFRRLKREKPEEFDSLMEQAAEVVRQKVLYYEQLAAMDFSGFKK